MDKYNNKCHKYFTSNLNHNYNISFYSNDDNKNFIIIKSQDNDLNIWADYKVLCSYNTKYNYLLEAKNMTLLEDKIKETNMIIKKKINSQEDLDTYIMNNIFDSDYIGEKYIGYVVKRKGDINYYFLINKIIRL